MFSPMDFTLCQAALSFEREDNERSCSSMWTCCFMKLPRAPWVTGPMWPKKNLTSRGAAAATVSRSHPVPQVHVAIPFYQTLCFHCVPSQDEGAELLGIYSVPHPGWGHQMHLPLPSWTIKLPEDTSLSACWLFEVWTPSPFLLQSKQSPAQHQAGCFKGHTPAPLHRKLHHSSLR